MIVALVVITVAVAIGMMCRAMQIERMMKMVQFANEDAMELHTLSDEEFAKLVEEIKNKPNGRMVTEDDQKAPF